MANFLYTCQHRSHIKTLIYIRHTYQVDTHNDDDDDVKIIDIETFTCKILQLIAESFFPLCVAQYVFPHEEIENVLRGN